MIKQIFLSNKISEEMSIENSDVRIRLLCI